MKLNKLFLITSIIFTLCIALGITANAATEVASGTCGNDYPNYDNLLWSLDIDGVLTISGSGEMYDYGSWVRDELPPWNEYNNAIRSIKICEGVTSISDYAFDLESMTIENFYIPKSLSGSIGIYNFVNVIENIYLADLKTINECFQYMRSDFANKLYVNNELITNLVIPDYMEYISFNSIRIKSIKTIHIPSNIKIVSFRNEISSSVEAVYFDDYETLFGINYISSDGEMPLKMYGENTSVYVNNKLLTDVVIPKGTTEIGKLLLTGYKKLKSIQIPKDVTNIADAAFYDCTNVENIYYEGSQSDWDNVTQSSYYSLDSDKITYNCRYVTYSFNTNGGSSVPSLTAYRIAEAPTTSMDNAKFLGWYDNAEFAGSPVTFPYNSSTKTTLYAKWQLLNACDVLNVTSPTNASFADTEIASTVTNSVDSLQVDVVVSEGATWGLYRTQSATKPLDNNTATGLREGRDNVYYIKTLAADETTTKTYKLTIYRNTKSIAPTISAKRDKVTIVADNCDIYYTIDGTTPTESSLKYTEPFSAPSNTVIKAIAKENGKDEVSDIIEYTVPEYITTNIETIYVDKVTNACEYSFYVTSDGTPSGTFIVAIYNDKGQLIGTKLKPVTIDGEQEIADTVDVNGTPDTYKAFFWDAFNSLKPICDAVGESI